MMKNLCPPRFFLKMINLSCFILVIIARLKAEECRSRYFKIVSREGPSLPPEEIISSHNVEHPVHAKCNFLCFNAGSKCVGYNFRAKTNAINCQLTNTAKNRNYKERGEWTLYRDVDAENEMRKTFAETDPCSEDVIAYYKFDFSFRDVCNDHNAVQVGSVQLAASSGVSNGAAFFNGASNLRVASLNGYAWGSQFSVSVWFKRTGQQGNYQGIINNGYSGHGSWEIRMGRQNSGQMIGGGIITSNSDVTWDYIHIIASFNEWHHVVMTYNGTTLNFYLDNQQQNGKSNCCQGNLINKKNDVIIGQAGHGMTEEFFYGYIDEVKLFNKALTADEVTQLYRLKHV